MHGELQRNDVILQGIIPVGAEESDGNHSKVRAS